MKIFFTAFQKIEALLLLLAAVSFCLTNIWVRSHPILLGLYLLFPLSYGASIISAKSFDKHQRQLLYCYVAAALLCAISYFYCLTGKQTSDGAIWWLQFAAVVATGLFIALLSLISFIVTALIFKKHGIVKHAYPLALFLIGLALAFFTVLFGGK